MALSKVFKSISPDYRKCLKCNNYFKIKADVPSYCNKCAEKIMKRDIDDNLNIAMNDVIINQLSVLDFFQIRNPK